MPRDPIWHGDRQYNLANDAVLSCEAGGKPNRSYRLWDLQVTYVLRGKIHDGYIIGFALRPKHRWGPQPCGHHLGTPIKFSPVESWVKTENLRFENGFSHSASYLNTTDCQPCCAMRISLVLVDLRKANTQEKGLMMWELLELILRLIPQEGSFSCNEFNYSIIPENIYHHVGADIQNKQVLIAPPEKIECLPSIGYKYHHLTKLLLDTNPSPGRTVAEHTFCSQY